MNSDDLKKVPKEQLQIAVETELAKRSFYEFFKMSVKILYPTVSWSFNWHFKYISDILQQEVERIINKEKKDRDYIINLPFRSGKSILISIALPCWCWIKDPSLNIMTVSSTDELATKFSHQSKILIDSEWFQKRFGLLFQIRMDQKAKGNFLNNHGGRRESFGINASILGAGCDIMLLDDIQSPKNATQLGLRNTIDTFLDVLYSRLNDPGISLRIVLQQRIHENDISGYLMSTNPNNYNHICIPAILTPDLSPKELVEFYEDNLFWKDRFTEKVLEDFRTTMRPAPFAGQLLQRPVPEEGDIIKRVWFRIVSQLDFSKLGKGKFYLFVDTAFTASQKNDPSAFLLCTVIHNNIYVIRAENYWLEFNDLLNKIREWVLLYRVSRIYVEPKASGQSILQELKRQLRVPGLSIMKIDPGTKSKTERVTAVTPYMSSGRVVLVEENWNEAFLQQMSSFPFGVHDDLVDVCSYSIISLIAGRYVSSSSETNPYEDYSDEFDLYT